MSERTLLIVDDEPNVLKSLRRLLFDTDYRIYSAESGDEGLKIIDQHEIQIVISDYRMPEMNGVEFLSKVKEKSPETIRMILSGYADAVAIVEAINEGQVYKFITKPWNDHELLTTILRTFEQYDLQKENAKLYSELEARNKELQEFAKFLEDKVAQRTRDLEIRNRALSVSQNILNLLPVGVLGVDSEGLVVYMNKALKNLLSSTNLDIGTYTSDIMSDRVLKIMKKVIQGQEPIKDFCDDDKKTRMIWIPLQRQEGVIGLFGHLDIEKYGDNYKNHEEKIRATNAE